MMVHLLVCVILAILAVKQIEFIDGQKWVLAAIFCLPAMWSVFILWKFRSIAERVVGVIAAISSLLWLLDMINFLR